MPIFTARKPKCTFLIAGLLLAGMSTTDLHAQLIALNNASFEQPDIPQADLSLIDFSMIGSQFELEIAIGSLITRDDFDNAWVQTGPTSSFSDPPSNQSGVFSNQPINLNALGIDIIVDPIANVHGDGVGFDQLGFILADPFADGVTKDFVSIHQESSAVFEVEQDYSFTLAVGLSSIFPAGDEAPLRIAIGYLDDDPALIGSEKFQEVAGLDITATQILDGIVQSGPTPLKDFTVDLPRGLIDASALGEQIAVEIRVNVPSDIADVDRFNVGGSFNFDDARLVAVPEPGSLALLAVGGLVGLRRRRR